MSKYNLSWDEKKFNKYIDEGRGQGIGKDYKPWITIHDFPSEGFSSRQPGWKSNRICHFLSHNELRFFYFLEWCDEVIDIREQYPMDLEDTMDIADKLGIKHPENRESKIPYVMTSDFMITANIKGKEVHMVRTIKPASELEKSNCLEHYEIERRYWNNKGIDWGVVTDNDIPKVLISNIEWAYYSYYLEPSNNLGTNEILYYGELIKDKLLKRDGKIVNLAAKFDSEMNLESGTSLDIIKHFIARKEIVIDLQSKKCIENTTSSIKKIERKSDRLAAI